MSAATIAFIDTLGARYLPHGDPTLYRRNLGLFQTAIVDNAFQLGEGGTLCCFNECAYVEAASVTQMIDFLRAVRGDLLKYQVFVKGAVMHGTLKSRVFANDSKVKILGAALGDDAERVFALSDRLKGIGFAFDPKLAKSIRPASTLVTSCHSPGANRRSIECIADLTLGGDELGAGVFKNTLIECLRINSEKQAGGRYFVTHIVSVIRSLDWRRIETGEDGNGLAVAEMLMDGWFETHFSDLIGMESVYGACLNETYSKLGGNGELTMRVFRHLGKMRRIGTRLALVPECLLARAIRNEFHKFQLDYMRRLKEEARQKKVEAEERKEAARLKKAEAELVAAAESKSKGRAAETTKTKSEKNRSARSRTRGDN